MIYGLTDHVHADVVESPMQERLSDGDAVTLSSAVRCRRTDVHPGRCRSVPADLQRHAVVVWNWMSTGYRDKKYFSSSVAGC